MIVERGIAIQIDALLRERLVKRFFDLVGLDFALMRNVTAPAAAIGSGLGKIDVLDDCGRVLGKVELNTLNHTVATPQTLDDFTQSASASPGYFADGFMKFKQRP